ncbi:MAG: efflux transporter outer membrane subunit [Burkholderiaceae bacterium]|nr:efflux transporter outer membrane subunit [Burkholderiaceae bacterium]
MKFLRYPIRAGGLSPSAPQLSLLAVLSAALLAGCSMAPTYKRPAAPVPAVYPVPNVKAGAAANTLAVDAHAAAEIDWRNYFKDPRLTRLIALALEHNRDLRVAVQNIEQARAQFRIQRAAQLPNLGLNASFMRARPAPLVGGVYESDALSVGISAWELDFFGRVQSLKEAARARYLATEEARKAVQISLIGAVANGWLTVLADDELLQITRETVQTREDSQKLAQLSFDHGAISEIDLRAAQSLTEAARATLAQLRRQRAQDENALALLLGAPVPPEALDTHAGVALEEAAPMADLRAGLPSELLERRPDIRAAEQQLIAANANIGAARANFFPRISLTADIGSASGQLSQLFDSGTRAWTFAPGLVLPLFSGGANVAALDSAWAARRIAQAQYEKTIQSAFREVADALAARATLGEQARALRAQAQSESVRLKLTDLRYRNGVASALDRLDAQRSLFAAQLSAIQVRLVQLQNQAALYTVLGGGWSDAPETAAAAPDKTGGTDAH